VSSHSLLEVECPSCHTKQDILIWQSIRVARDPELREQLFTGRINYFTCGSCGFEGFITAPLEYDDPGRKICARYVPVEFFNDEEYLKQTFLPDGRIRPGPSAGTEHAGDTSCRQDAHLVFSMSELIRYVLFRDRLEQVLGSGVPE
jgi:hypothetical protein